MNLITVEKILQLEPSLKILEHKNITIHSLFHQLANIYPYGDEQSLKLLCSALAIQTDLVEVYKEQLLKYAQKYGVLNIHETTP